MRALILARPAWTFGPAPRNLHPYIEVADALRRWSPAEAKTQFAAGETGRTLAREAPDNLASLLGFFDRHDPATTADLLTDIASDGPGVSEAEAAALRVKTLVIGHGVDHAHPLATAETLATTIPGARLVRVPPKATDKTAHLSAVADAVRGFLDEVRAII